MGQLTISMAIFNSYVTNYQRVPYFGLWTSIRIQHLPSYSIHNPPGDGMKPMKLQLHRYHILGNQHPAIPPILPPNWWFQHVSTPLKNDGLRQIGSSSQLGKIKVMFQLPPTRYFLLFQLLTIIHHRLTIELTRKIPNHQPDPGTIRVGFWHVLTKGPPAEEWVRMGTFGHDET